MSEGQSTTTRKTGADAILVVRVPIDDVPGGHVPDLLQRCVDRARELPVQAWSLNFIETVDRHG